MRKQSCDRVACHRSPCHGFSSGPGCVAAHAGCFDYSDGFGFVDVLVYAGSKQLNKKKELHLLVNLEVIGNMCEILD